MKKPVSLKEIERRPTLDEFAIIAAPRFSDILWSKMLPRGRIMSDAAKAFLKDKPTAMDWLDLTVYSRLAGLRYYAAHGRREREAEQAKAKRRKSRSVFPEQERGKHRGIVRIYEPNILDKLWSGARGDKRHLPDLYFVATMWIAFRIYKGDNYPAGWSNYDGINDERTANEFSEFYEYFLRVIDPDREKMPNLSIRDRVKKMLGLVLEQPPALKATRISSPRGRARKKLLVD